MRHIPFRKKNENSILVVDSANFNKLFFLNEHSKNTYFKAEKRANYSELTEYFIIFLLYLLPYRGGGGELK